MGFFPVFEKKDGREQILDRLISIFKREQTFLNAAVRMGVLRG